MIRGANAVWRGTGRDGNGSLTTDSHVLTDAPYSFRTRFENENGTNPEELIAAAHAGGFTISRSELSLRAEVPGLDEAQFKKLSGEAERDCPVSKLLNATIALDAKLV